MRKKIVRCFLIAFISVRVFFKLLKKYYVRWIEERKKKEPLLFNKDGSVSARGKALAQKNKLFRCFLMSLITVRVFCQLVKRYYADWRAERKQEADNPDKITFDGKWMRSWKITFSMCVAAIAIICCDSIIASYAAMGRGQDEKVTEVDNKKVELESKMESLQEVSFHYTRGIDKKLFKDELDLGDVQEAEYPQVITSENGNKKMEVISSGFSGDLYEGEDYVVYPLVIRNSGSEDLKDIRVNAEIMRLAGYDENMEDILQREAENEESEESEIKTEETNTDIGTEESETKPEEPKKETEEPEEEQEETEKETEESGTEQEETDKETEGPETEQEKTDKETEEPEIEQEKTEKETEEPETEQEKTGKETEKPEEEQEKTGKETEKPEEEQEKTGKETEEPETEQPEVIQEETDKETEESGTEKEETDKETEGLEEEQEETDKETEESETEQEETDKETEESETEQEETGKETEEPETDTAAEISERKFVVSDWKAERLKLNKESSDVTTDPVVTIPDIEIENLDELKFSLRPGEEVTLYLKLSEDCTYGEYKDYLSVEADELELPCSFEISAKVYAKEGEPWQIMPDRAEPVIAYNTDVLEGTMELTDTFEFQVLEGEGFDSGIALVECYLNGSLQELESEIVETGLRDSGEVATGIKYKVPFTEEGINSLVIKAVDQAGNQSIQNIEVQVVKEEDYHVVMSKKIELAVDPAMAYGDTQIFNLRDCVIENDSIEDLVVNIEEVLLRTSDDNSESVSEKIRSLNMAIVVDGEKIYDMPIGAIDSANSCSFIIKGKGEEGKENNRAYLVFSGMLESEEIFEWHKDDLEIQLQIKFAQAE